MPEISNPPAGRSALDGHYLAGDFGVAADATPGVTLSERRGLAIFIFDGPADDAPFLGAVEERLGFSLPLRPNTALRRGGRAALWVAPGRWQIEAPAGQAETLSKDLAETLADRSGSLLELAQARTVIRVSGPRLRDLLGKGCPLDLHPRVFAAGACAQSVVAGMAATLQAVETGDGDFAVDLQVMRSFGLSFWQWLIEAAAEYGYRVLPARAD